MFFDNEILSNDFEKSEIEELEEKTVLLSEGHFREGQAEPIRGVFRKKFQ